MPPPLAAAAEFGIAYRPMVEADLAFIEALYASTRSEELALTGWPEAQQLAFLAQQHRAQHQHYRIHHAEAEWLIVERGGQAIGRLILDKRDDLHRVIDISLVPAARGRGIGGAILSDVIAAADEQGKGMSIHVEMHNPARHLYDRLGFVIAADEGIYLRLERPARPPAAT